MAIEKYSQRFFKNRLNLTGSASSVLHNPIAHFGLTSKVVLCPSNIRYSVSSIIEQPANMPGFHGVDIHAGNPSFEGVTRLST